MRQAAVRHGNKLRGWSSHRSDRWEHVGFAGIISVRANTQVYLVISRYTLSFGPNRDALADHLARIGVLVEGIGQPKNRIGRAHGH